MTEWAGYLRCDSGGPCKSNRRCFDEFGRVMPATCLYRPVGAISIKAMRGVRRGAARVLVRGTLQARAILGLAVRLS